jgi:UDP-N-acetyl-D-mannosaminuronate dehydrogenase
VDWTPEAVAQADCVIMLTPHSEFMETPFWQEAGLIVDTRNVVPDDVGNVWRI